MELSILVALIGGIFSIIVAIITGIFHVITQKNGECSPKDK
jgi:hypothetical protein